MREPAGAQRGPARPVHQVLADRPQEHGRGLVLGRRRWGADPAFDEVLTGDVGHLRGGGQVHRGPGALFWGEDERLDDLDPEGQEALGVVVAGEAGGDRARVETVGRHPGAGQSSGQLRGEQDVGQLGAAVGLHAPVVPGGLEVVEVQTSAGPLVCGGGHGDHPGGGRLDQAVGQQPGEQEGTQMVDPEGGLEPVHRLGALRLDQPGVVDQNVDPGTPVEDLLGPPADGGQVGQVEHHQVHLVRSTEAADVGHGLPAALLVAGGDDGGGTGRGQRHGRGLAHP